MEGVHCLRGRGLQARSHSLWGEQIEHYAAAAERANPDGCPGVSRRCAGVRAPAQRPLRPVRRGTRARTSHITGGDSSVDADQVERETPKRSGSARSCGSGRAAPTVDRAA